MEWEGETVGNSGRDRKRKKTKHEIIDPIAIEAERWLKESFTEDDGKKTMRNKKKKDTKDIHALVTIKLRRTESQA